MVSLRDSYVTSLHEIVRSSDKEEKFTRSRIDHSMDDHSDMNSRKDKASMATDYTLGKLQVVEYLTVKIEAVPVARDSNGLTTLHVATNAGHLDVARLHLNSC